MVDFHEHLPVFRTTSGDVRDPHPRWAQARRETPVQQISMEAGAEGALEDARTYAVHRYDDVVRVLREADVFSSTVHAEVMGPVFGHSILEMDAPEHSRHRSLVAQAFRPRALDQWRSALIEPIIHDLIDRFAGRGHADLVAEFTFAYPARVIAAILGVPDDDVGQFQQWAFKVTSVIAGIDQSIAAAQAMKDYFRPLIADRRARPQGDLISGLVTAEIDGERLTDEEIFPFILLLSPAGAETTFCATGNLLVGLLSDRRSSRASAPIARWCRAPSRRRCAGIRRSRSCRASRCPTPCSEARRSRRAPGSCRSSRQPTATRRGGRTPIASTSAARRSRTWPSRSGRTCAW
jgi:cytochrome P450